MSTVKNAKNSFRKLRFFKAEPITQRYLVSILSVVTCHISYYELICTVTTLLLFQQTAVQSAKLFLIRTVDKILQTCLVVKNSAATIQTDMAVSDSDA